MSKLLDALRKKYASPQDAIAALGLDAKLLEKEEDMAKLTPAALVARSALFTYLAPRLAQDKSVDLTPIVTGITSKNFASRREQLKDNVIVAARGKLAMDADLHDLANLLDAIQPQAANADQMTTAPSAGPPMGGGGGGGGSAPAPATAPDAEPHDTLAKIKQFLEEQGVSPEIINNLDAFAASAGGEGGPPAPPAPGGSAGGGGPPGGKAPPSNGGDQNPAEAAKFAAEKPAGDDDLEPRGEEGGSEMTVDKLSVDRDDEACDQDDEEENGKKKPPFGEDEVIPSKQEDVDTGAGARSGASSKGGGASDRAMVTKGAMDRAIKIAQDRAIRNQRAIRDAERFVRPWVGDIAMDAAGPADIYRSALKMLNVKGADTMHQDALRPVLEAQPRPTRSMARPTMATDAAPPKQSFLDRFPEAKGIRLS